MFERQYRENNSATTSSPNRGLKFSRSCALIDTSGTLIDWDMGFELEFFAAVDQLKPGCTWTELIVLARTREGFGREASRDIEDSAFRAFEYRALGRIVRVVETRLAGGWCMRTAQDVTSERAIEQQGNVDVLHLQRDQSLERLMAGVVHEFNNVLMIVLGNAESILKESPADSLAARYATIIKRVTNRGADLSAQSLSLTQHHPQLPDLLDLCAVIDQFTALVQGLLGAEPLIDAVVESGVWPISVDQAQLQIALLNMILQGRRADRANRANRAGGTVAISVRNERLTAGTAQDLPAGDYVSISVQDIVATSPDENPLLTRDMRGNAVGMGSSFAVAEEFARRAGGILKTVDQRGRGQIRSLILPRAHAAAAAPTDGIAKSDDAAIPLKDVRARALTEATCHAVPVSASGVGTTASRQFTILLVDDHDLIRTALTANLQSLNYRVLAANSGATALTLLRGAEPIDLLFTDVVMPGGVSGSELARQARILRPDIKVLFSSGFAASTLIQDGRIEPDAELLMKPYEVTQLVDTLSRILIA
jgi:CheY-like chemotaxis protein/signal transduction histidine kinase